ncbi:hypothetical protein NDU88_006376 [Pleurodeles waltl]|uniref:Uncharacterized protein n=1 Tax=Pleurodeles waltl TaxID=8319 RepID=A0AAV7RPX5_PLEWA|nr:hypothetical protein NDU88_006376 [Pleurodeles waltl]
MLSERGTQDSHKPHPDVARPLPCGPGALSLLQFTKTAALTLAGGRWMDPWPKASCRMLGDEPFGRLSTYQFFCMAFGLASAEMCDKDEKDHHKKLFEVLGRLYDYGLTLKK